MFIKLCVCVCVYHNFYRERDVGFEGLRIAKVAGLSRLRAFHAGIGSAYTRTRILGDVPEHRY